MNVFFSTLCLLIRKCFFTGSLKSVLCSLILVFKVRLVSPYVNGLAIIVWNLVNYTMYDTSPCSQGLYNSLRTLILLQDLNIISTLKCLSRGLI